MSTGNRISVTSSDVIIIDYYFITKKMFIIHRTDSTIDCVTLIFFPDELITLNILVPPIFLFKRPFYEAEHKNKLHSNKMSFKNKVSIDDSVHLLYENTHVTK